MAPDLNLERNRYASRNIIIGFQRSGNSTGLI